MALVTGFFAGRVAAALRCSDAVGAFPQQTRRALHSVRVVTVQAGCLPYRGIGRKVALGSGGFEIGFFRRELVGVSRIGPQGSALVMAGHTYGVIVLVEGGSYRRRLAGE